ncbi:MAG: hypothetical protein JSR31_08755 [Nitrospira sp.]|nr:hypothetical protein [Nitrospira sp.]
MRSFSVHRLSAFLHCHGWKISIGLSIILTRKELAHGISSSRANYLTLTVPDTVAAIGTRITLETEKGKGDTRPVIGTVEMLADQTPELGFGLGKVSGSCVW